ncbi:MULTISPECIES: hypothetical protein [Dyella]|uniref:Uncharacterized protein n=2 Tax=Dyella TaxID=231454 RepID=A0A4R0YTM0_9GAMM|nr:MULTISPECIES: hypothetical protein [Dyella]TBR36461.1 hypothetical protein EYV96_10980 [Dyella terrae]TCI08447.1 hypothetical protein EZM97_27890 [Dyella soli]
MSTSLARLLCFTALTVSVAPVMATEHLTVTLSHPTEPSKTMRGYVVVTLLNDGDTDIVFHKFHTPNPANGRTANKLFEVYSGNRPIRFTGGMAHPGPETPTMFFTLKPGQSQTATVYLRRDYDGIVVGPETYRVKYIQRLGDYPRAAYPEDLSTLQPGDPRIPHAVESNELELVVSYEAVGEESAF